MRGILTHNDVIFIWGGCNGKWKDVKVTHRLYLDLHSFCNLLFLVGPKCMFFLKIIKVLSEDIAW